jgi:hypothetical protein
MCLLIVDVNVAARVLLTSNDKQYDALHRSIFGARRPNPVLAYGGQLTIEFRKNVALGRILGALDRAGRAKAAPTDEVNAQTEYVKASGVAKSDDPHILALAQVAGARVLCSEDKDLRTDFKNKALVDGPRGKLYSKSAHKRVLSHNC